MRGRLLLSVAAGAAALGSGIGLVAVAAWLIARAAERPPVLELMVAVVAVRALGIGKGVFRYVERLVSHDVAFRALATFRQRVYRRLVRLAPAGLAGWRGGDLLTRLVDDVAALQDRYVRVIVPAASAVVAGLLAVGIAAALLPVAGVVLAIGLVGYGVVLPQLAVVTAGWADRRLVADRAELAGLLVETVDGADELTVLGAIPHRRAALDRVAGRLYGAESRLAWARSHPAGLGILALGATVVGTLLAAVPAVDAGRLDGPALAVLALLPIAAFDAVGGLAAAARDRAGVRASLERVAALMAAPDPMSDGQVPSRAGKDEPAERGVTAEPGHPGLVVRDIRVRWPGAVADAVCGVDLDLPPGKRVAIVGPSGAGKSTLLAALVGLCPYRGEVRLAGVPLRDIDEPVLRRTVSLAASDAYTFDSTLAANLRLARPDATDAEISSALARAGLLGWVEALPLGLQTSVGEHGRRLSGGERQRLGVARALLADTPVLLCDEPDASVEPALADQILADVLAAAADRGVVVVTHQTDRLPPVDEVLVMDSGVVVDRRAGVPAASPAGGAG